MPVMTFRLPITTALATRVMLAVIVGLLATLPAAAQEAKAPLPDPPAQPPAEVRPEAKLEAPPSIVELDWTAVNTSASLNLDNGETHYTIRLSGKAEVPADTPILAVSHQVILDQAVDKYGRDLLTSRKGEETQPSGIRTVRHFNGIQLPEGGVGVSTVYVAAMLNGVDDLPTVIRSLQGQLQVLVARSTATVELDGADAMDAARDVSERVAVQTVKTGREGGEYELQLRWRLKHDPEDERTYYSNLRMIRQVILEDDDGNRLHGRPGERSAFQRSRDVSEGTMSFRFSLPPGRAARSLQAEVVTELEPSSIRIHAENIPMPGFQSLPGV